MKSRVLEEHQVWKEDGKLSFGWVVFNVAVIHSRRFCRVGGWRHRSWNLGN